MTLATYMFQLGIGIMGTTHFSKFCQNIHRDRPEEPTGHGLHV